ncbi:MAG: zinc-ribbon domain-containing protein [Acutalibacteraceae bacterium]
MKFCPHCGAELKSESSVVCLNCGSPVQAEKPIKSVSDDYSKGLVVLSVLIPIFGLVWWLLKKDEKPKEARYCGIAALISFCVSFCFGFVVGFMGAI